MELACPNACHPSPILCWIYSSMEGFVESCWPRSNFIFNLDHNISILNIFVDHYLRINGVEAAWCQHDAVELPLFFMITVISTLILGSIVCIHLYEPFWIMIIDLDLP